MFKRLSIVAFNTGLSQLLAMVAIGFAARSYDTKTIGQIGIIESSIILTISIISFGLQLVTNRNIVINQNWFGYFEQGQKARVTLSILLFPLSLVYFLTGDVTYLLFLGSPLIALNGDYALYGRGLPEYASTISFVRVLIPSIVLIFCSALHTEHIVKLYSLGLFSGIFIAGFMTSFRLKTPYFFSPGISSLKNYVDSIKIGGASVSITMMSSGVIFAAKHFYEINIVGEAYLAIKLFLLYQGVRRIVIQAFFNKLNNDKDALKVDRINILIGILSAAGFIFFPGAISALFYGDSSGQMNNLILVIGFATLFSSLTSVADTKMLLKKMDREYFTTFFISMIITMSVVISLSLTQCGSLAILVSIITGEISILLFCNAYVGFKTFFAERFKILFSNLFIILLPLSLTFVVDQTFYSLFICMALMMSVLFWTNKKHFK